MDSQQTRQVVSTVAPESSVPKAESDSPTENLFNSKVKLETQDARSRKLVPLLPKPIAISTPHTRPVTRGPARSALPGPCGIPQCDRLSCRLVSHRQYVKTQARLLENEERSVTPTHIQLRHRKASFASSSSGEVQPTIAKAAGFPPLPLDEFEQKNPILRQLFHDFFVKLIDRVLAIIMPPFSGYPAWLKQRHKELFQGGLNSQLDCLNCLGAAHAYFSIRSATELPSANSIGIIINNDLMKQLRDMLENYDATKDADRVLSIIYTLVLEDLNTTRAQTGQTSLLAHRTAMKRVIESRGGLHNMGYFTSLAVSLDRLIAMQIGQAPLYSTWENQTLNIQRVPLYPVAYGTFFMTEHERNQINLDITTYCAEVCRAIEILEGEDWHFDGKIRDSTPEIFYLYYLRERVANKFAHLNARFVNENTRDRCILLAAKIVEYIVLMDDYIAATTLLVANRLRNLINQQDLGKTWKGWEDVFLWVIFVLACMPEYWAEKEWALSICFGTLQRTYGRHWPTEWERGQQQNIKRFVWSTSRLDTTFQRTCAKLQSMALQSLELVKVEPN